MCTNEAKGATLPVPDPQLGHKAVLGADTREEQSAKAAANVPARALKVSEVCVIDLHVVGERY